MSWYENPLTWIVAIGLMLVLALVLCVWAAGAYDARMAREGYRWVPAAPGHWEPRPREEG